MRKIISVASCLIWAAVTVVAASGCADQVRTVPASTATAAAKPNFKSAIQGNPNIPDNVKQRFGGAGAH